MSDSDRQPGAGRPRPVATVLDVLRKRIDYDAFDAAIFSLEAVAANLSGASGQAAGTVIFTFSDASGTVDPSSVQTG